jgi:thiol-disulfide isomerase/thioredoxin
VCTEYTLETLIASGVEPNIRVNISITNNEEDFYEGHLLIFVVEPESRWNHYSEEPYHFGFLDFAFDATLAIPYQDTFEESLIWNSTEAGWSGVQGENIMVIAAVYNPEMHQGYAHPPNQHPFDAYYVDATAGATPGTTGYNEVTEDFTHTVLCEEATATWCPPCPNTAEALKGIYESHDYPFYFVALVADKNSLANARVQNYYNLYGYPTCFFDGGYRVHLGGSSGQGVYRTKIEECGLRDVHELNLSVSLEWLGSGAPEKPSIPEGTTIGRKNVEYTYTSTTTDPEGEEVYYKFDWGDSYYSEWVGPYGSGELGNASHSWSRNGDFQVRVKAKDINDQEGKWSDPLNVHILRPKINIDPDDITGGFFTISAVVENLGDETFPVVNWNISVTGGILGLVDSYTEDIIESFAPGDEESIQTKGVLFGLGPITVTVAASEPGGIYDLETKEGFILLPYCVL